MDRLVRSLFCYLFQPVVLKTDFPFIQSSDLTGRYMGRLLYEHTYGGILVANAFMVPIWIAVLKKNKKSKASLQALIIYLVVVGLLIAGFDANGAGIIYRYTCDFAPAFVMAAVILWILFLDRGQAVLDYSFAASLFYVCFVLALGYSFLTFVGSGSTVCLENDNKILFNAISEYFKF